jgi:hypothetical protein
LKPVSDILKPDSFWVTSAAVIENSTGLIRPYKIDDFYNPIAKLKLNNSVPTNVRQEFDAACHTFVYCWLSYDLATVAEHYAYAVLEMSLRIKLKDDFQNAKGIPGLKKLLEKAFEKGLLSEQDYELKLMPDTKPLCQLRDVVVRLRNNLSHGDIHRLIDGSEMALELCCNVINKLFSEGKNTVSKS